MTWSNFLETIRHWFPPRRPPTLRVRPAPSRVAGRDERQFPTSTAVAAGRSVRPRASSRKGRRTSPPRRFIMLLPAGDPHLAGGDRPDGKDQHLWTFSESGQGLSFLRIKKRQDETLVLLYLATGWYELRRLGPPARPGGTPTVEPITAHEFEELAGLRKAQAWGTPMFQPGHANYQQALARIAELETKERAAST
jgi:hypothetical protein